MKVILESERSIGNNPFDFLAKNLIPDGSFVSIGYITDGKIKNGPNTRCYITPKNDAELTKVIDELDDDLFKEYLIKFQNSDKYQKALLGKRKTAPLDFGGCHIVKISRNIVNWKNPKALAKFYADRAEAVGDLRVKYGFGDYPEEYDEDDWRRNPDYNGTGRWEISRSKGGQNMPYHQVMNLPLYLQNAHITDDNYEENKNKFDKLYLRQVRNQNASYESIWLFVDTEGNYFFLNRKIMNWLRDSFNEIKLDKVQREIQAEEQAFLKELHNIKNFDMVESEMLLDNVLYLTGTTVNDNKEKEPFTWYNDVIVSERMPFLSQKKWNEIIHICVKNSTKETNDLNENMKVRFRKTYRRRLNERF